MCGIISLLSCCCCFLSTPLSITAIVCGILALNQIKAEPDRFGGKNQAIIGIVLGSIGIVMMIVGLLVNMADVARRGHF